MNYSNMNLGPLNVGPNIGPLSNQPPVFVSSVPSFPQHGNFCWSDVGTILVLFILLVIISRCFC